MGLDNVRVLIKELIEHCWIFNGIFPSCSATHLIEGIVQLVKVITRLGPRESHYFTFHSKHNQTLSLTKYPGHLINFASILHFPQFYRLPEYFFCLPPFVLLQNADNPRSFFLDVLPSCNGRNLAIAVLGGLQSSI